MVGVGVDADVVAVGELRQGSRGRRDFDDLELPAEPLPERDLLVVCAPEAENLRHGEIPLAYRRSVLLLS